MDKSKVLEDLNNVSLKTLLEHAHIGMIIHRWDTSVVYASPAALSLLGLNSEQIIGIDASNSIFRFIGEDGKLLSVEDYPVNKVKRTKQKLTHEIIGTVDTQTEETIWFVVNAYYEGENIDNRFIIVTFTEVSGSKRLFSFQDVVENTQDIVIITEAGNIEYPTGPKIVYVNHAFEKLTGYTKKQIIGETPRILQGSLTDTTATKRIYTALSNQQQITETLLNYDIHGRAYWVEMNIIPLNNKYGDVTHFAAIERDVTESKFQREQLEKRNQDLKALKGDLEKLVDERTTELQQAKAQLEKIAFIDPLTKIPNRRLFSDQANKLIKSCERRGGSLAFGVVDIDDFKAINDQFGHDVGDDVLIGIAKLFLDTFRADDAFCRLGGEEFAFAVAIADIADADVLAEKLQAAIRALKVKCVSAQEISITASIGIKVAIPRNVILADELKQADAAMYYAKQHGKNSFCVNGQS